MFKLSPKGQHTKNSETEAPAKQKCHKQATACFVWSGHPKSMSRDLGSSSSAQIIPWKEKSQKNTAGQWKLWRNKGW
jgi:hypothetical protein